MYVVSLGKTQLTDCNGKRKTRESRLSQKSVLVQYWSIPIWEPRQSKEKHGFPNFPNAADGDEQQAYRTTLFVYLMCTWYANWRGLKKAISRTSLSFDIKCLHYITTTSLIMLISLVEIRSHVYISTPFLTSWYCHFFHFLLDSIYHTKIRKAILFSGQNTLGQMQKIWHGNTDVTYEKCWGSLRLWFMK